MATLDPFNGSGLPSKSGVHVSCGTQRFRCNDTVAALCLGILTPGTSHPLVRGPDRTSRHFAILRWLGLPGVVWLWIFSARFNPSCLLKERNVMGNAGDGATNPVYSVSHWLSPAILCRHIRMQACIVPEPAAQCAALFRSGSEQPLVIRRARGPRGAPMTHSHRASDRR